MQIKRDVYLDKLIRKRENGLIKIITGMRRCGKSYLLFNLFKSYLIQEGIRSDHIIEIDLESRLNKDFRNPDYTIEHIKSRVDSDKDMYYLLLDEIQYMDEFEDVLNTFMHFDNLDVYVTGSNSKFLSSDIITEFRGRGDEIRVYPLNFREFSSAFDGTFDEAWDEFIRYGSLPYILSLKEPEDKTEYLLTLFNKVYLTDVLERNKIQHIEEMEEVLNFLASSIGSYTSVAKLANTFKSIKNKPIADVTVKKFISFFEDSFLITAAKKYDIKGKNYIQTPTKYYFDDVGIRNAMINFRQIEETHLMENVLFNELKARGFKIDVGSVSKYRKDKDNKTIRENYEVDFVANKGSKRVYIQSAYTLPTDEKEDKELRPFNNIDDNFRKIIVVKDKISLRQNAHGIEAVGLKDFLLEQVEAL